MRKGSSMMELMVASSVAVLAFGIALGCLAPAARCAARAEKLDAVEGALALRRWVERDLAAARTSTPGTKSLVLVRTGVDGADVTVEYREDKQGRVMRTEQGGRAHVARVFRGSLDVTGLAARPGFTLKIDEQVQTYATERRSRLTGKFRPVRGDR